MSVRNVQLAMVSLLIAFFCAACGSDAPVTQRVQLASQLLDIGISEDWELETSTDTSRVFVHKQFREVRLHLSSDTEDFGNPLRVRDVKSLIGKEMNKRYGGVSSRVTFGGNAVIKYTRNEVDHDGDSVRLEEWVLAKPFGYGQIARVEFSLRIPPPAGDAPEILTLIEGLDKQIGDATIPRA